MPGFNGTGPSGRGPGTGRGAGYCVPKPYGYTRGYFGRGRGAGRGFARGAGWGPCRWWAGGPGYSQEQLRAAEADEKEFLKEQSAQLKAELADLEQRISELDQPSG